MTAREQAREAVSESLRYDVVAWHPQAVNPTGDAADAASDVWEPIARRLAKDVLMLAAVGGMPDTYWLVDSRIQRACEVLGWTHEKARSWARVEAGVA